MMCAFLQNQTHYYGLCDYLIVLFVYYVRSIIFVWSRKVKLQKIN